MTPVKPNGSVQKERPLWPDDRLVGECLRGSEEAWSALIDKYKSLIFSIPIKYGFSVDDATEIFQAVCLLLLSELPRLRKPRALAAWLIELTSHKCYHWKHEQARYVAGGEETLPAADKAKVTEDLLHEIEREQMLREALAELSPRCHEVIRMLFFQSPPLPYQEMARSLGVATGSIGFIRRRCLERLKQRLEKRGFR